MIVFRQFCDIASSSGGAQPSHACTFVISFKPYVRPILCLLGVFEEKVNHPHASAHASSSVCDAAYFLAQGTGVSSFVIKTRTTHEVSCDRAVHDVWWIQGAHATMSTLTCEMLSHPSTCYLFSPRTWTVLYRLGANFWTDSMTLVLHSAKRWLEKRSKPDDIEVERFNLHFVCRHCERWVQLGCKRYCESTTWLH